MGQLRNTPQVSCACALTLRNWSVTCALTTPVKSTYEFRNHHFGNRHFGNVSIWKYRFWTRKNCKRIVLNGLSRPGRECYQNTSWMSRTASEPSATFMNCSKHIGLRMPQNVSGTFQNYSDSTMKSRIGAFQNYEDVPESPQNTPECHRVPRNLQKPFRTAQNTWEHFRTTQNTSECRKALKTFPSYLEVYRSDEMPQNALKRLRTLKYIAECLKTLINLSVQLRTNESSSERLRMPENEENIRKHQLMPKQSQKSFRTNENPHKSLRTLQKT